MVSLIFLVLALAVLLSLLVQKLKPKKGQNLPPGPNGLPFLGNLHQFDFSAPPSYLWKLSQTYGALMFLRLGSVPTLVVSSAKMAKEILKTQDFIFCSRPPVLGQQKLSYNGLDLAFAPYTSCWREMKKICMVHLFNFNRVQTFRPIRESENLHMLEKISKLSSDSKLVNLSEVMVCLTCTIICRIACGKRYEEEAIERTRFQALLHEAQALLTGFFVAEYFPILGFIDKLTGMNHRLEKNFKELDIFYDQIIQEHLDPNRPKVEQKDILDVLLEIWKDQSFKANITHDHIKATLMNVFLGGGDTIAAPVVWAMTFLMKNPTAMKKAQEEVRSIVGVKGFVDEDDTQQLVYLKAAVKEVMRLQPPIPLIPRQASQDCKLGKYDIPAKTVVHVNVWAVGRDPEAWENPEMFSPERFIGKSIDMKGLDFELIPFGAGRRSCPGVHMSLATVELSLANLLYKFNWEMPAGMKAEELDMDVNPGITMNKKTALRLVATRYI